MAFRSKLLLWLAALILLLLDAGPVLAQQSVAALLKEGEQHYKEGRFKGSIRVLQRAARVARDPRLLGQIYLYQGRNLVVLGDPQLARAALILALTHDATVTPAPKQDKQTLLDIFEAVRSGLKGTLAVTCEEQGGAITVDGREVGKNPLVLELTVGLHRLQVHSADRTRLYRDDRVVVRVGERTAVRAVLTASPGTISVSSSPPGARVLLDGKELGTTPIRGALTHAGTRRLVLRKEGFEEHRQQARVPGHGEARVAVTLRPQSAPATRPGSTQPDKVRLRPSGQGPPPRWFWTWFALGGAVAAAGVGLGMALWIQADVDQ